MWPERCRLWRRACTSARRTVRSTTSQISLQGSRTADVLWLVDGIRINNRLYAGTTPLDTIPASMIERIEVLDGGQALFYGTQAVAGAVNIVTKSFTDHPDGAVSLGGDSNNGKHLHGYFRDAIGKQSFRGLWHRTTNPPASSRSRAPTISPAAPIGTAPTM